VTCVVLLCWWLCACSMFVHPHVQQEHAGAFDAAVAGLRYGSISINCPATTAFSVTSLPWGAFPGQEMQLVRGWVGSVLSALSVLSDTAVLLSRPCQWWPHSDGYSGVTLENAAQALYVANVSSHCLLTCVISAHPPLFALLCQAMTLTMLAVESGMSTTHTCTTTHRRQCFTPPGPTSPSRCGLWASWAWPRPCPGPSSS
jgi:hypothetical protein